MTSTQPLSRPRGEHNAALAKKFGLGPVYPPATKQLEALPFNRRSIKPYAYNPSIVRWGKRVIMAYRWHPETSWKTRLHICELDDKWQVISDKEVDLGSRHSEEDPHLFTHQDHLHMSWIESVDVGHCVVKYGSLNEGKEWTVPTPMQPKYGRNDGNSMEKNFVFNGNGSFVSFIYSQFPNHVTVELTGDEVRSIDETPADHWPWGLRKGGVICGDIRFFHSTLENESNPDAINNPNRRYYIGCQRGSKIASRPILYGSELCDLTQTEMSGCRHYKANVVFCSGAIQMPDDSYVLSIGANDCQCALLRVKEEDLNL